jgi:protein-tyrosine-phosphatase
MPPQPPPPPPDRRVIRLPEETISAPPASFEIALVGGGSRAFGPLAAAWLSRLPRVSVRTVAVQDLPSVPPPVDVIENARRWGLEIAGHRTLQLLPGGLRGLDLVLGWDRFDVDTAVALGGAPRERAFTLGEFAELVGRVRTPDGSDPTARVRLLVARAHRARSEGPLQEPRPAAGESVEARIRRWCAAIGRVLGERKPPVPPPPAGTGFRSRSPSR